MAYARFSPKSAVYVIGSINRLECLACRLTPRDDWYGIWHTTDRSAMVEHLQEHRQRGQKVPFSATRRLKREIRTVGNNY